MYEEIENFLRNEANTHLSSSIDDLDGKIPKDLCETLQTAFDAKKSEHFKVSKRDALCKRVYDLETAWKWSQFKDLMDTISDIPRYSIGTELRDDKFNDSTSGVSIDKLLEDILKLPKMGIANPDYDMEERDSEVLSEYNNLRKELMLKCKAIKFGSARVREIQNQVRTTNALLESIRESKSSNNDISGYFLNYHEKLLSSLGELSYLLEEAIKTSDTSHESRLKLLKILREP